MTGFLIKYADYCRGNNSIQTAKNIITRKTSNCHFILTRYIARYKRSNIEKYETLFSIKSRIHTCVDNINNHKESKQELLLEEARIAQHYYDAIAIITKQVSWKRYRGKNQDLLNEILNIGYHLLSLECEKALLSAGLYLEEGFLHGPSSGKPLLYDFMEIFRQPFVDRLILPLFSRKNSGQATRRDLARFLKKFKDQWEEDFWYKNRCESLRRILQLEAYSLRRAIEGGAPYQPFYFLWGNTNPCNKKAPSTKVEER